MHRKYTNRVHRAALAAAAAVAVALAVGPVAAQPPQPAAPAQPPPSTAPPPDASQPAAQFETRADVVLVDVTVMSGDGNPVADLSASDFVLTVNGKPRDVHTVQFISATGAKTGAAESSRLADSSSNAGESSGRLLLFVIDENYLRVGSGRAVLRTAERVLDRLAAGDLVGLTRLPTGRGGVEFTTDRNRIRRALSATMGGQPTRNIERVRLEEADAFDRNDTGTWRQVIERECGAEQVNSGTISAAMAYESCVNEVESHARNILLDAKARTRMSVDAFEQLAQRLSLLKAPVNIILLSEGLYIGRDRTSDLIRLAELSARARISFFVVQPDESLFDNDNPRVIGALGIDQALSTGLEMLAGMTRGEYFKVATSGAGVFDRISRQLSGYYLLSFEPTEADRASRDRRIKVEVKRRGLTVRSRATYAIADAAAAAAAAKMSAEEQIKSLLTAPLPTAGLPMRVASYSVTNAGDKRVRVIISAEIGEAAREPAEWPVGLLVIDKDDKVVASAGGPTKLAPASDRTDTPRLLLTSMLLEPGEYTLRLAAVGGDGSAGSVHHTIDAKLLPLSGDAVRASDLILTSDVGNDGVPRPMPSAVIYSESMAALLDLAGPDGQRLASSTVKMEVAESETGPALVSADARAVPRAADQRGYVAALKLGVLPPGEYVARAVVSTPGQPDTHLTRSFRLAPVASDADASPIATRVANDEAPAPLPMSRIVAPVTRFAVEDVLKPDVVRGFLDDLQLAHPVSAASAPIVQQARTGKYVATPADGKAASTDEAALAFIRGLAQLEKKQYAQAAAWFQVSLKHASDFLGAAFYLGAVHAANGRDKDAVGAWQMSLLNGGTVAYPMLVDALLRTGDGQGALDLIAEAPDAWPNDEARLRRVVTAQAMLGQFEPAMETLNALLQRRKDDADLLFVAIQVLYRQHLARALPAADRTRFDDYSQRYVALAGPDAALVETWRRYVLR